MKIDRVRVIWVDVGIEGQLAIGKGDYGSLIV